MIIFKYIITLLLIYLFCLNISFYMLWYQGIPDLKLNEEESIYGKYGMLRKEFLREYRSAKYQYLLVTGKLTTHLNQVDQEAREQVRMLVEQMAEKQGVTETLKKQDQMKWVGLMNNIKASAEEIVLKNIVYI